MDHPLKPPQRVEQILAKEMRRVKPFVTSQELILQKKNFFYALLVEVEHEMS